MAQKCQGSLGIITSVVSDGWCDCICYWVYVRKDRLICISEKNLISHLRSWVYSAYLDDSVYSTDNIQENYLKCNKNNVIQD